MKNVMTEIGWKQKHAPPDLCMNLPVAKAKRLQREGQAEQLLVAGSWELSEKRDLWLIMQMQAR